MPDCFLPEGHLLTTHENLTACARLSPLRPSGHAGAILEGVALMATPEYDLLVRCGPFVGRIPHSETALGIVEGSVRDIAILSRVGKPVRFTVIGWEPGDSGLRPILSRRQVQERAKAWLDALPAGTVLPARVTRLEHFGAFVDVGCGLPSLLSVQRICVSRIPHPAAHLACGQQIWVAVLGHDRERGHLLVTHRELLGTWEENISPFAVGMTVPGVVRGIHDYGSFIELTPNLSGLAECRIPLTEGERVSVHIKSISPRRRKIKLSVIDHLPPAPAAPLRYFLPPDGRIRRWQYAAPDCERPGMETVFS